MKAARPKTISPAFGLMWLFVFLMIAASFTALADNISEPAWVYKGRGDRYYRNGQTGQAIYEYKKGLIMANRSSSVYPEINLQLAKIYRDEGLYDLALSQVETVQKHRDSLQVPDLIYETLYTRADIYLLMKRYDEALKVYEGIIEQDKNRKLYSTFSIYELRPGDFKDPLTAKRYAEAYLGIGMIKYMSFNYENAIPALKMAMLYSHKPDITLNYLINCYEKMEDSRAIEYLLGIMETQAKADNKGRS